MTQEQQFALIIWLFGGILAISGVLIAVIFNSFKRTQENQGALLQEHDKELTKLKEKQYLKIEHLETSVTELKAEVHELRRELKEQIAKENDVLQKLLLQMNTLSKQLKHGA